MPVLLELLEPKKDDVILDAGAGTGVIADAISKLSDEVFALEPDPKRVEFMKKKFPQVKAFDGSAEAIQFPESYFTKIYTISAFHHFRDKETALYEFHRVLKRNGTLVIKDSEPQARVSRFERHAASGVSFMASDELKQKLEEIGFKINEVKNEGGGNYYVSSSKI
jgi:ubiquinone/menaquinone biosynthesis C-methylase UbiE